MMAPLGRVGLRGVAGALLLTATVCAAAETAAPPVEEAVKLPPAVTKANPEDVADLKAIQDQVRAVLKKTLPATVAIVAPDPAGRGMAAGSGVIVTEDGYV